MHYTTVVSLEMSDEPNVWPNEQKLDMRLKYVDKVAKRLFLLLMFVVRPLLSGSSDISSDTAVV